MAKLARLAYLLACHPFRLHQALVRRGLAQKWIRDFLPFWDTIRPPGLPIKDFASFTFLEYWFSAKFREMYPDGDHFECEEAQFARLLSYVHRREMHPLRMLKVAWHLRKCREVLEFGAGAMPYAHFIETAWPLKQFVWTADVEGTLLFDYQMWRLGFSHFADCALIQKYDGIVCTEVFEHLNNPAWTAIQMMAASPLICFDYVDDGSEKRRLTFEKFRMAGALTGPDKRGLYVWRKA